MKSGTTIQCLDRAMDVLQAIADRSEAGVTELARGLGLPPSTVHNIVATLAARGYLHNDGGRYRLGPALAALVPQSDPALLLPGLAAPVLSEVACVTGEPAVAGVLAGQALLVIASTLSLDEITVQFPNQNVGDPLAYAMGQMLVACLPEQLWEGIIQRHLAFASAAGEDRERWRTELERTREQGHAVVRRASGTDSYAVPVAGPRGEALAALGVSCASDRSTARHELLILSSLREARGRLESGLRGASDPGRSAPRGGEPIR